MSCSAVSLLRCMEGDGDWAKVLEVIDSENAETAVVNGEGTAAEANDERLFLSEDGWDGRSSSGALQRVQGPGVPVLRMHGP